MKITEIKRTVSDMHYSNMSATATVSDGEDPIQASIELDTKIKEMLAAIKEDRGIPIGENNTELPF